jgi:hypothetical protein
MAFHGYMLLAAREFEKLRYIDAPHEQLDQPLKDVLFEYLFARGAAT